jgi:hypothetical protein
LFCPKPESGATGNEQTEPAAPGEQLCQQRRRLEDMFEIVYDDERLARPEMVLHLFEWARSTGAANAQCACDGGPDQTGVVDWGELHDVGWAVEHAVQALGHREGEPSLSHSAGTGQCHLADLSMCEHADKVLYVGFAADQARRLAPQISCAHAFGPGLSGQIAHGPQRRALGGTKVERRDQLVQRALARSTPTPAFQCRDTLGAQPGALGELLLRQSGRSAPPA